MGEYFCEICKFFDDDVILPSEIDFSALVYWILILYCQNIRFFIAIELPLLPSYYLVVIWFLMYGTCLTFVVDANLIWYVHCRPQKDSSIVMIVGSVGE